MPRVLVLDDEPLISMMIKDWLEELGYDTVGPAASIKTALSLLSGPKIDGAILDVSLSDGECYLVADALHALGVPFAFATGRGERDVAPGYDKVPILAKPFDFAAVKAVMLEMLRGEPPAGPASQNRPPSV